MDFTAIGAGVGTLLAAGWGTFQTFRAKQHKDEAQLATRKADEAQTEAKQNLEAAAVSRQLSEKAATLEKLADEWRIRWDESNRDWNGRLDKLTEQHEKDREGWHTKASKDQATLSKCQEETMLLKGRTDMQPLIDHIVDMKEAMKDDAEVRKETMGILAKMSASLDRVHGRIDNVETKFTLSMPK